MSNQVIEVTVPEGTKVRIGVPSEQPEEAIAALKKLFLSMRSVLGAHLGLMEMLYVDGTSQFSYTIGIHCESGRENIEQEALRVLQSVPTGRWPISIVPLTAQYFTQEAIVFYVRSEEQKVPTTGTRGWLSRLIGK
jgi:hypothetical protein